MCYENYQNLLVIYCSIRKAWSLRCPNDIHQSSDLQQTGQWKLANKRTHYGLVTPKCLLLHHAASCKLRNGFVQVIYKGPKPGLIADLLLAYRRGGVGGPSRNQWVMTRCPRGYRGGGCLESGAMAVPYPPAIGMKVYWRLKSIQSPGVRPTWTTLNELPHDFLAGSLIKGRGLRPSFQGDLKANEVSGQAAWLGCNCTTDITSREDLGLFTCLQAGVELQKVILGGFQVIQKFHSCGTDISHGLCQGSCTSLHFAQGFLWRLQVLTSIASEQ